MQYAIVDGIDAPGGKYPAALGNVILVEMEFVEKFFKDLAIDLATNPLLGPAFLPVRLLVCEAVALEREGGGGGVAQGVVRVQCDGGELCGNLALGVVRQRPQLWLPTLAGMNIIYLCLHFMPPRLQTLGVNDTDDAVDAINSISLRDQVRT